MLNTKVEVQRERRDISTPLSAQKAKRPGLATWVLTRTGVRVVAVVVAGDPGGVLMVVGSDRRSIILWNLGVGGVSCLIASRVWVVDEPDPETAEGEEDMDDGDAVLK